MGFPITDEVNRLTTALAAAQATITSLQNAVTWEPLNTFALSAGWSWGTNMGVSRTLDGKFVRFKGTINRDGADITANTNTTFMTLPVGYRPVTWSRFPIATGTSASARLQVDTGGTCQMISSAIVSSGGYVQLDVVQFPTFHFS